MQGTRLAYSSKGCTVSTLPTSSIRNFAANHFSEICRDSLVERVDPEVVPESQWRSAVFKQGAYLILAATFVVILGGGAHAACTIPNTLTNGQTADATQVMGNFGSLKNCVDAAGSVGSGTAGQLGYFDSSGNAISGKNLTDVLDAALGSSRGSILYRGATGWVLLAPGTSGYVLQTGGPSADPSWSPSGGGSGSISSIVGGGVSSAGPVVALSAPLIARPALASLSWVNQASATAVDNTNGPLVLKTTQNTGGSGLNALTKTVAGGDWTVTVQYALGNHIAGTNVDMAGLIVRDSSSGHIYICGINGSTAIGIWTYSSPTAWSGSPASKTINVNYGSIWTRASYSSATTTITFLYSIDGLTWETIFSTNSSYVGAGTDYGIAVGTQGNSSGYVLSLNYLGESTP